MTNDNAPPAKKPIAEKFATALNELIDLCTDAGIDPADLIGPLKKELLLARQAVMPTEADDTGNAQGHLPPLTEAQLIDLLQLEPHEPIPPRRTDNT